MGTSRWNLCRGRNLARWLRCREHHQVGEALEWAPAPVPAPAAGARCSRAAGGDGGGRSATPGAQGYVPAPCLSRWVFPLHSQEVFLAPRPPKRQGSAGESSPAATWTSPALLLEAARKFKALPAPPSRAHSRERASTPSCAPHAPHPHCHIHQSWAPASSSSTDPSLFFSGFVSAQSTLLAAKQALC